MLQTEDQIHLQLPTGTSDEIEIFKGVPLLLKVSLVDRELPLSLTFIYNDKKQMRDLLVFYSMQFRRPSEGLNHGVVANVSLF